MISVDVRERLITDNQALLCVARDEIGSATGLSVADAWIKVAVGNDITLALSG